ncbi:MAG TPA: hypothetical protein VF898_08135 [Chloroflexota bacterium]
MDQMRDPVVRRIDEPRIRSVKPRTPGAPRRQRFRRRHTPHYFLVLAGLAGAVSVCTLNTIGFVNRSVQFAEICFAAVALTALLISVAFFWGFFMLMNGRIPSHRLRYFVPHGAVGVLSPLLYTLNISTALDDVGSQPVSGLSLVCSYACLGLLCIQFAMGKAVVRPPRLRVL